MLGSSPSPDEPVSGYPRVVRLGKQVFVSGTTAADEFGRLRGHNDARMQMTHALENLELALGTIGADRTLVTSVRVLVPDFSARDVISEVHRGFFGESAPPISFSETNFLDPMLLLEVEAEATLLQ